MSESVEAQLDIFKTEHSTQYVLQVVTGDETEHIICTYPRFWKEDRYLVYVDETVPLVIHCIPQNSKVKLAKEIVQCMNKDGIKKLRRSSGTDDVQEEETKLEADIVDSLDEIMDIITAVIGFGKLRDNKKRASTEVDAEFRSSKHGTSIHVHERFLDQIEPLSKELRRTYSERVEEFASIRGRLTNRGMLRLVTHPSNRFECKFDDFFVQAPIYRIVSTCLGIIASKHNMSKLTFFQEQFDQNRTKAMRLLFAFSEVQPYDSIHAIRALQKFIRHPPREFRNFHPISGIMMQILLQEQHSLATHGEVKPKFLHLEYSNLIWEDYLEKCIGHFTESLKSQEEYDPAWTEAGGKNKVDLSVGDGKILVDAKYTEKENATKAQYQHQMFYYMMAKIARNKLSRGPECIVLAYPVSEHHFQHQQEMFELGREIKEMFAKFNLNPTKLIRLGVPLPDQARLTGSHAVEEITKAMVKDKRFQRPFEVMSGVQLEERS